MEELAASSDRVLVAQPRPELEAVIPCLEGEGWDVEKAPSLLVAVRSLTRGQFSVMLLDAGSIADPASAIREMRELFPDLVIVLADESPAWIEGIDARVDVPEELPRLPDILSSACSCRESRVKAGEIQETLEKSRDRLARQAECIESIAWASSRWRQAVMEPQELYSAIVDCFQEVSGARRSSLMLKEQEDAERLRLVSARGLPSSAVEETRMRLGESIAGWVAQEGEPLMQKPPWLDSKAADHHRFETDCFLCLPLQRGGEVIGVQNLSECPQKEKFDEWEVEYFNVLAHEAAAWVTLSQEVQDIRKQALLDELTGVYNRRYFDAELEAEIERAKRTGQNLALGMVDIDHFKRYNDIHGHPAGDRVLKEIAQVLQAHTRTSDTVCRYGGEEFTVILPDTGYESTISREKAVEVMDRVRRAVADHDFPGEDSQPGGELTLSAGIALFREDGFTASELVEHADHAMYAAKQAGRNRVKAGLGSKNYQEKS